MENGISRSRTIDQLLTSSLFWSLTRFEIIVRVADREIRIRRRSVDGSAGPRINSPRRTATDTTAPLHSSTRSHDSFRFIEKYILCLRLRFSFHPSNLYLSIYPWKENTRFPFSLFFFLFSLFFSYVRCSTCKRGSDKRQSTRHEPLPAACHNRKRRIVPLDWLVNRIIMSSTTGQRDNDTIVAAPADHASSDFLLA